MTDVRSAPIRAGLREHVPIAVAGLVGVAIDGSVLAQGGFYRTGQLYLAAVLSVAAGVLVAATPIGRSVDRLRPAAPALALATWAVVDGALHGATAAGVRLAALAVGTVGLLAACRRLDASGRDLLRSGLIGAGVLVAALGWLGVVRHDTRWAIPGQGLWRASATLTYPNALATLLAVLAVYILAELAADPTSARHGLVATALLTGAGATLSRAGLLAVLVGMVAVAVVVGPRSFLRGCWPAVGGAGLAVTGLLTAAPEAGPPRLGLPAVTLIVGLAIGGGTPWLRARWQRAAVATGLGLATALTIGSGVGRHAITTLTRGRATLDSPDRLAAWHAVGQVISSHFVTGAGPGLGPLSRRTGAGVQIFRYAHNEYLQLFAELGVVGLVLLVAAGVSVGRFLRRTRPTPPTRTPWAGAVGSTLTVAVAAGFDFIGHFPAIPLTAAALVGLATPARPARP